MESIGLLTATNRERARLFSLTLPFFLGHRNRMADYRNEVNPVDHFLCGLLFAGPAAGRRRASTRGALAPCPADSVR